MDALRPAVLVARAIDHIRLHGGAPAEWALLLVSSDPRALSGRPKEVFLEHSYSARDAFAAARDLAAIGCRVSLEELDVRGSGLQLERAYRDAPARSASRETGRAARHD